MSRHNTFSVETDDLLDLSDIHLNAAESMARKQAERIEYAIQGAILGGYDGVDIVYPQIGSGIGVESIEPWYAPAPKPAQVGRVHRYEWPWFDNETLKEIAQTGEIPDSLLAERH